MNQESTSDGLNILFQYGAIGVMLVFMGVILWWVIKSLLEKFDESLKIQTTANKEIVEVLKEQLDHTRDKHGSCEEKILVGINEIKNLIGTLKGS